MYEGKRVLVTGGRTGFVGTNFAKELHRRGAEVMVQGLHADKPSNFDGEVEEIITDLSVSAEVPKGTDYIFHCAAHTSGAKEMAENPEAQIHVNAIMNSRLLEAASREGVKRFLFISSSALYPEVEVPVKESMAFNGDPPGNFFGPGWMKRYTEKILEFYHKRHGMDGIVIRPSNIYGPFSGFDLEYSHVLPALIRKFVEKQDPIEVWGDPKVVRDFIYVDDFVDGSLRAFEKSSGFDVYNIASGQLRTIGGSVELIQELTDYKGRIKYDAAKPTTIKKRSVCTDKAKAILGFEATTDFKDGLKRTIDWYRGTL